MNTSATPVLTEHQRLNTHGARAVEPFQQDGALYLAVPQLAHDLPGQSPAMTAGEHGAETLVYRWADGVFALQQSLPVPAGEDAEAFCIGERRFLATASLRVGSGPYRMDVDSVLYEWVDSAFQPFQSFATFAAKQWHHFSFDGRHFLALAQGITLMPPPEGRSPTSCIYEWDGERFVHRQDVPAPGVACWGYNWRFMAIDGQRLLAYADHVSDSLLLRWDGERFVPLQVFEEHGGRAFCHFEASGQHWLAFASLHGESWLYRWTGQGFTRHQRLSGPGGREFAWLPLGVGYLVQVNFIHGTREAPLPELKSFVHAWRGDALALVAEFDTSGGTDAALFEADGQAFLAVSNSLTATQSFHTDTVIYRLDLP